MAQTRVMHRLRSTTTAHQITTEGTGQVRTGRRGTYLALSK